MTNHLAARCWLLLHIGCTLCDAWLGIAIEGFGNGTIARTLNSGQTWEVLSQHNSTNLYDLTLLGATSNNAIAVGANGTIFSAISNASTSTTSIWSSTLATPFLLNTQVYVSTTVELYAIAFSSALNGTAVGSVGYIYNTFDGGQTWSLNNNASNSITTQRDINGVAYATGGSSNIGYAVGNVQLLWKTTDGGMTWYPLPWVEQHLDSIYNIHAMDIYDANTVTVVGNHGLVLHTADGGVTWTQLLTPIGTAQPLLSVKHVPNSNAQTILVSGNNGTLYRSTDGGQTWSRPTILPTLTSTDTISSLYFASATLGVAVSRNRVMFTQDGGASFQLMSQSTKTFNYINQVYILAAPVLQAYPPVVSLSLYNGQTGYKFTLLLGNTGTANAQSVRFNFTDSHIRVDASCGALPTTIAQNQNVTICLLYDSSSASAGRVDSNITIFTDSYTGSTSIRMYAYVYQAPSVTSTSWFAANWWMVVVPIALTGVIIYFLVVRRMTHVKQYNRRIKDRRHHIGFWDAKFIHRMLGITDRPVEHDDDSDFWSSDDEDDDNEYSESYHWPDSYNGSSEDGEGDSSMDSQDDDSGSSSESEQEKPAVKQRALAAQLSSVSQRRLQTQTSSASIRRIKTKGSVTSLLGHEDLAIARHDVLQRRPSVSRSSKAP